MESDPSLPALFSIETSGLFKDVVDTLPDGVYFTDRERRIRYWNRAAEDLTGYKAEEVLGKRCADNFVMHVDESGCLLCEGDCPLSHTLADGLQHRADVYLHHKNGHRVPVEVRVRPIWGGNGEVVGAMEIFNDNSRQRAVRERAQGLARFAFLDPTSQIGNRGYLEQQLSQQLDLHRKYGTPFGIMLADLDEFKKINDTHGHVVGDVALATVARILSNCLRASDVVGRWGGDEFLAILPSITRQNLAKISEKFRRLVAESTVPAEALQIRVTISVGATIVAPGDSPESLLKRADQQLYSSKQSGRNRVSAGS
ncbi:MAG: diguanylate cyclase [Terriglobia bacterium]|jgi:diguanylate cyclase (GGDEF)-like protein/PAS domain S-box-containing protein